MPAIAALVILLAAAGWLVLRPSRSGAIVLISIDTLRADRLPIYGYGAGRTPTLTAHAAEAIVFDRAYAHAPQTLPSHASMFTGLLPFDHKVRDNLGFTMDAGLPTMASLLRTAGYRTAAFVSSYVLRGETNVSAGFDLYDATFPPAATDRAPAEIVRDGPATLAAATTWLASQSDDRFFLFFHIYEPHAPYEPPPEHDLPDKYDGEVAFSDHIVGGLFSALRQHGWYDDALIVVTSDHGEGLGDHVEREHGLFLYDEVVHVPLFVKLPRSQNGGRRIADPVQHIDLLPTLASLAGFTPPAGLRGRDLSAALRGGGSIQPAGIYAEAMYSRYHFGWSELSSLIDGRYKYIKAPRPELYDLERDPDERQNLAADRGQAAAALRAALDGLLAGRGVDAPSAVSDEDRERLAALGYVGSRAPAPLTAPGESLPDPKDKAGILVTYREAIELASARRYDEALRKLRLVVQDSPGMIDAWIHTATVLTRMERPADAFEAYREAIRRNPDESGSLLGAASTLISMGRLDEAKQYAELAVRVAPAYAHQVLGNIALSQNQPDEALRQADLAARADPTLPAPALTRGLIEYRQQRYREALPHLVEARKAYAARTLQTANLHFYIADSLAQLERYREAEPFFLQEIALFPQNVRARTGLAMLYQAMGRPADAERVLNELLRAVPSPAAYQDAAVLWEQFGRPDRAAAVRAEARARFGAAP